MLPTSTLSTGLPDSKVMFSPPPIVIGGLWTVYRFTALDLRETEKDRQSGRGPDIKDLFWVGSALVNVRSRQPKPKG